MAPVICQWFQLLNVFSNVFWEEQSRFRCWTISVTLLSFWSRSRSTFNSFYHLLPFFLTVPPSTTLLASHTCSVTGAPQLLWWVMERASWRSCPHPGPTLQISSMDAPWKDRRSLSNCVTLILTQHLPRCYIFTFCSTLQPSDAEMSLELPFRSSFSLFWNTEMWNIVYAYVAYYAMPLSYTINALKKLSSKQSQESTIRRQKDLQSPLMLWCMVQGSLQN